MVNLDLLNFKIRISGISKRHIAKQLEIDNVTLFRKLKGRNSFTCDEAETLCRLLGITTKTEKDAIFFARNVNKSATQEAQQNEQRSLP